MTRLGVVLTFFGVNLSTYGVADYVANALVIQNEAGHHLVTNRDVNCLRIGEKQDTITVSLIPQSRIFLYEYTVQHRGEKLVTTLCGREVNRGPIADPLSLGEITIGGLKEEDLSCIKRSFVIEAKCSDCPVCNSYGGADAVGRGFKLGKVQEDSIYRKLGLKEGDVVRKINGQVFTDGAQAMTILNSLKGARNVKIELERSGKPKTISIKEIP